MNDMEKILMELISKIFDYLKNHISIYHFSLTVVLMAVLVRYEQIHNLYEAIFYPLGIIGFLIITEGVLFVLKLFLKKIVQFMHYSWNKLKWTLFTENRLKQDLSSLDDGLKFALEDIYCEKNIISLKEGSIEYLLDNGYIEHSKNFPYKSSQQYKLPKKIHNFVDMKYKNKPKNQRTFSNQSTSYVPPRVSWLK